MTVSNFLLLPELFPFLCKLDEKTETHASRFRFAGVKAGATGWDSESMQHYGDRIKCKIAPVHTKDRNPIMADWIS